MRTTLTLEDDIAGLLKERARQLGIPFKEIVNRTLRSGLGNLSEAAASKEPPKTIPHSFGFRSDIDLDSMNKLADDLEAEALAVSISRQSP